MEVNQKVGPPQQLIVNRTAKISTDEPIATVDTQVLKLPVVVAEHAGIS